MQKHHFIFLFSFLVLFSFSKATLGGIISLPRYQGSIEHKYRDRNQSGGKEQVNITCSSKGGVEKGANQICTGAFSAGGRTCYSSCSCNNGYKANASGACVAKTCSDYGLESSNIGTKSCTPVSKAPNLTCHECVACNTSTYKYTCSGTGYAASQTGTACNKLYSECKCATNYRWDSSGGKCVCDGDYIANSSGVCSLKTCSDYSSSYLTKEEKEAKSNAECEQASGLRSGLECWNCTACDSSYKYTCSSITNNNGGDGTACGGKYAKCKCKDLYSWDNLSGTCGKDCTKNSCSTTTYPLTAQNVANAISYEECTPNCSDEPKRYKVANCATNYNVNSAGSACEFNVACNAVAVTPPENASCSNINSCNICTAWTCNSGYNKSGNTCAEICSETCLGYTQGLARCKIGQTTLNCTDCNGVAYYKCEGESTGGITGEVPDDGDDSGSSTGGSTGGGGSGGGSGYGCNTNNCSDFCYCMYNAGQLSEDNQKFMINTGDGTVTDVMTGVCTCNPLTGSAM